MPMYICDYNFDSLQKRILQSFLKKTPEVGVDTIR